MKKILIFHIIALTVLFSISSGSAYANTATLKKTWVPPFMLMAEQLTAGMIQNTQMIGTFFDAKHQLETQRLLQQKVAEAHKDYHPSEQLCEIGTFVRGLADSQERIRVTRNAIQNAAFARALGTGSVKTMDDQGSGSDQITRRKHFIDHFCNTTDSAGSYGLLCGKKSGAPNQQNADINYTQTIDTQLTLDFDPSDGVTSPVEQNIYALLDNVFMNKPFPDVSRPKTMVHKFIKPYQEMRSWVAMMSVPLDSFAYIIGEKTKGPKGPNTIVPYLNSLLQAMGLGNNEITEYIGDAPSYHAQMELLTSKIFQHPEFISNLYDKPANVKRIRTALTGIERMQQRDIEIAMERRAMLISMIAELQLREKQERLQIKIEDVTSQVTR